MGHHGLAIRFRLFRWSHERVVDAKENRSFEAQKRNDFQAQYLRKHAIRSNPARKTLMALPSARIEVDQPGGLMPIKAYAETIVIVRLLTGSVRRGL